MTATATAVREGPVLMSGPMVRATMEDRKTRTRRVVTNKTALQWLDEDGFTPSFVADPGNFLSPYGYAGDYLWVRERHCLVADGVLGVIPGVVYHSDQEYRKLETLPDGVTVYNREKPDVWKWRPSIHMRREWSRTTLEITELRIERLQDMPPQDFEAEGCVSDYTMCELEARYSSLRSQFRTLWDSLNADRGYGWDSNPWVWVIGFRRLLGERGEHFKGEDNG